MEINIPELQKSSQILHLLAHRNKNQHRQAHWWKWLSMLRRNIAKLMAELKAPDPVRSTARVDYLRDHLFPRCHVAFTQVVRDSQFSALGLVLVAELARVGKVVGFEARREEAQGGGEDEIVEYSLKDLGREDFGEAVERPPGSADASNYARFAEEKPAKTLVSTSAGTPDDKIASSPKVESRTVKRQKRRSATAKKKGKNVIDQLFRGFD